MALTHINRVGTEISSGGEFDRHKEFLLGTNGIGAYVASILSLRSTREAGNRESGVDLRRYVFDCHESTLGAKELPVVLDHNCCPTSSSFALDPASPLDKQVDSRSRNPPDRLVGSRSYSWMYCFG